MTANAYTEDQLVEQPAIGLFAELGWQTMSAMEEQFGAGGTLGRETSGEVVLVPKLRAALVRLNRTRADYLEKFQALIDDYNAGSRNIEDIFRDLLALSGALTEEQDRHVREHLSEEELTVFDILTRPGPELTQAERDEVKKVARQLLERLHALLVLNWRQKIQSRAQIRLAIEDALDEGLPRTYTKDLYQSKCAALFEHVYESYLGDGASVYRDAA